MKGSLAKLSPEDFATVVVDTIQRALAPMLSRLGAVDSRLSQHDTVVDALQRENLALKDRVLTLEATVAARMPDHVP